MRICPLKNVAEQIARLEEIERISIGSPNRATVHHPFPFMVILNAVDSHFAVAHRIIQRSDENARPGPLYVKELGFSHVSARPKA